MHRWFCAPVLSGALITLSSDVFGRNEVATANGLTGMAARTASTMFALVVGALADTIGFSPLFAVLAVFDLLGAVVIWTVLKSKSAEELAKSHSENRPRRVSIAVPGGATLTRPTKPVGPCKRSAAGI